MMEKIETVTKLINERLIALVKEVEELHKVDRHMALKLLLHEAVMGRAISFCRDNIEQDRDEIMDMIAKEVAESLAFVYKNVGIAILLSILFKEKE